MQIKRFEAKDMTEALKMIKSEFGSQAVILSAKTIKKSTGLFGAARKSGVEITAASDRYQSEGYKESEKSDKIDNKLYKEIENKSSFENNFAAEKEFIKTEYQERKLHRLSTFEENSNSPVIENLRLNLREHGLENFLIEKYIRNINAVTRHSTSINTDDVKAVFCQMIGDRITVSNTIEKQKNKTVIIAFVGPTGVGKTTTIAKLSAVNALDKKYSVALISMDHQRIGATATLEKYAGIIGLSYKNVASEQELKQAVDEFYGKELILIDTPGVAMSDAERIADLGKQLAAIAPDEVCLLLSATTKNKDMNRLCDAYSTCGRNRLIFTKIDETSCYGNLLNLIEKEKIPLSYITNGQIVPEHLIKVSPEIITDLFFDSSYARNSMQNHNISYKKINSDFFPQGEYFVANKNSDIFHHYNCKAVDRINKSNIVVFQNTSDAKNQNFKPCRMCCNDMIGNTVLAHKFKQKVALSH